MRLVLFALLLSTSAFGQWSKADRSSIGVAPLPADEPRAVVQVYAARTVRWRKYFAVHAWVATKEKGAGSYLTHEVIGWRARRGLDVVVSEENVPDRKWFGH